MNRRTIHQARGGTAAAACQRADEHNGSQPLCRSREIGDRLAPTRLSPKPRATDRCNNCDLAFWALTSAFAGSGRVITNAYRRCVPILLQKSLRVSSRSDSLALSDSLRR
jgi:hypothetical protein